MHLDCEFLYESFFSIVLSETVQLYIKAPIEIPNLIITKDKS